MLEDKILEQFVPHRQRSFSSLLTIVVGGDKGKNMAGVFSCGKCYDMVGAGGVCFAFLERALLSLH